MNTYSFKINTLTRDNSDPARPNLITRVDAHMYATNEQGHVVNAGIIFDLTQAPAAETYTDFADLTEEQVKGWCQGLTDQWSAAIGFLDTLMSQYQPPEPDLSTVYPPWLSEVHKDPMPTKPVPLDPTSIPVAQPTADWIYKTVTEQQVREIVMRVIGQLELGSTSTNAGGTV